MESFYIGYANGAGAMPRHAEFAPRCSKLQRLPNKQAFERDLRLQGSSRNGKSPPIPTGGLARPLLIRR
jgi:hypothetical protein